MAGVVQGLHQRLPHQRRRTDQAILAGQCHHLQDGCDAATFLTDRPRQRSFEFDFATGVAPVTQLVLQALDPVGISSSIRRKTRQQEATEPAGCLRQYQEGIAHRRRQEPFVPHQ